MLQIHDLNAAVVGSATVYRVKVTPELAARLLAERNTDNYRKLVSSHAELLAGDMVRGKWSCSAPSQAVLFDPDGILMDGQHRLKAVVVSGKTVEMWFCLNVPEEAREYLDQGRNRTCGEVTGYSQKHIAAGRMFLRVLHREWESAPKHSISYARPLLDAIYSESCRVDDTLAGSAGSSSAVPVRAAMVFNLLACRNTAEKAKVLDLIDAWKGAPGTAPTALHYKFRNEYPANPNGQAERMNMFLRAVSLFDPVQDQTVSKLPALTEPRRDKVRGILVGCLGEVAERMIGTVVA